ncbi:MAG: hypothetical protein K5651_07930 [Bacteroidales bacterium]|nr:hypothetical protein [Bacteroidales bacterium]
MKLLKYKVSLPGIKGFARYYLLKPDTSLYAFHKLMRSDMDFPQDQIVIFKAVDDAGEALARFSVKDLGKGTIDTVKAGVCHKEGWDHFVYFYDTTNRKSVLVDFVEETLGDDDVRYPLQAESEAKGPNPIEFERGYVALEDMPDDTRRRLLKGSDEDDDVDDDDDDDDGDDDDEGIEEEDEFDEDELN